MKVKFEFKYDEKMKEKRLFTYINGKLLSNYSTGIDVNSKLYGFVPVINRSIVRNYYKDKSLILKMDNHTVKTMVEQIRKGQGDAILRSHFLGATMEHLVYFEDRKYGEEIKHKSIEGYKDTEFAYCVLTWHPIENRGISKDNRLCYQHNSNELMIFNSRKEAKDYIYRTIRDANELFREYVSVKKESSDALEFKFFDKIYDDKFSIGIRLAFENMDDFYNGKDDCINPSRFFSITDCIKPKKEMC